MNRRNFLRGLGGGALALAGGGFVAQLLKGTPSSTDSKAASGSGICRVRIIGPDGKLTEPIEMPKVVKTDAEWHKQLTAEQFDITRGAGTETPFCGAFYDNHKDGIYHCVCCNLPLFASGAKFDSGTGWPSFFQPVAKENIQTRADHTSSTTAPSPPDCATA
jgi:hypothetical protein